MNLHFREGEYVLDGSFLEGPCSQVTQCSYKRWKQIAVLYMYLIFPHLEVRVQLQQQINLVRFQGGRAYGGADAIILLRTM